MCHYTHFTTEEREKSRVLKAHPCNKRIMKATDCSVAFVLCVSTPAQCVRVCLFL